MSCQILRKKSQFPDLPALDLELLSDEIISAEEFLKRYTTGDKEGIRAAEIIPPKLGQKGFGFFRVKRNAPIYG